MYVRTTKCTVRQCGIRNQGKNYQGILIIKIKTTALLPDTIYSTSF